MIKYHNDGKQKEQSHEGQLEFGASTLDWWWTCEVTTYGPNKVHVDMHLRACLDSIIKDVQKAQASLGLPNEASSPTAGGGSGGA